MGENSKISWTDHTFNPWIGCTKVAKGCANCYAEDLMDKRHKKAKWGAGNPRQRTSEANWKKPLKWQKDAERAGRSVRVFCASLADVFDAEVPQEWRADLFRLIEKTPNLTWLLLTKRPENVYEMAVRAGWWDGIVFTDKKVTKELEALPQSEQDEFVTNYAIKNDCADLEIPGNVWIGYSVAANEDISEGEAFSKQYLGFWGLNCNKFLSVEPLIESVQLRLDEFNYPANWPIRWVIVGGESGNNARPFQLGWALSIKNQCRANNVPFFMKQLGRNGFKDYRNFATFPDNLQVRELPDFQAELVKGLGAELREAKFLLDRAKKRIAALAAYKSMIHDVVNQAVFASSLCDDFDYKEAFNEIRRYVESQLT